MPRPLLPCLLLTLVLAPSATAETLRFEAESGNGARPVADRGASGRRAVLLTGRASLRKRLTLPALASIRVRARGRPCGGWPRIAVSVADRSIARLRVRSRRWRRYA